MRHPERSRFSGEARDLPSRNPTGNGERILSVTPCLSAEDSAYNFPRNSVTSGAVQSTGPMNLRRITPPRSMMNVSGHPCVP